MGEIFGEFGEGLIGIIPKGGAEGSGDVIETPAAGSGDEPAALCHALHDASGDGAFADAAGAEDLAAGFAAELGDGFGVVCEDADDFAGFAAAADEVVFLEEGDGAGGGEARGGDDGDLIFGAVEDGLFLSAI